MRERPYDAYNPRRNSFSPRMSYALIVTGGSHQPFEIQELITGVDTAPRVMHVGRVRPVTIPPYHVNNRDSSTSKTQSSHAASFIFI